MMEQLFITVILAMTPIIEGRGAVVYGIAAGLDPITAFTAAAIGNAVPALALPRALRFIEARIRWRLYHRYVNSVRSRGQKYVEKYGMPGLVIFVAVPLPASGVYSGAVLAHVLGVRRAEIALLIGAMLSTAAATAAAAGVTLIGQLILKPLP